MPATKKGIQHIPNVPTMPDFYCRRTPAGATPYGWILEPLTLPGRRFAAEWDPMSTYDVLVSDAELYTVLDAVWDAGLRVI